MEGRPLREGVVLKPHQKDGVKWLLKSFLNGGAILADEMGKIFILFRVREDNTNTLFLVIP